MPQDRYQTVQEVADRLEVAEATVRQWIKSGCASRHRHRQGLACCRYDLGHF